MPIDFQCQQCGRLLRTPDETAGKQAKCPACGNVQEIPSASTAGVAPPEESPFGQVAPPRPPVEPSPAGGGAPPQPPQPPVSPFGAPSAEPPWRPDSQNPYQAPAAGPAVQPHYGAAPAGQFVHTRLDAGATLDYAWSTYKDQWTVCVLALVIVYAISLGAGMVVQVMEVTLRAVNATPAVMMAVLFLANVASQLVGFWLGIGVKIFLLKVARRHDPSFTDLFAGGRYLIRVILASILIGLMVFGAVIVCLVPGLALMALVGPNSPAGWIVVSLCTVAATIAGIVLYIIFSQYQYLIIDRNVGVIDSLMLSRDVTAGNRLMIFILGLIYFGLSMLGILACCIGLVFTLPLAMLTFAVAYLMMTGQLRGDTYAADTPPEPAPQW